MLISSLKLHKVFADEIKALGIDCEIYDIYEMLESMGIPMDRGFYERRFLDEDFEGIVVGEE